MVSVDSEIRMSCEFGNYIVTRQLVKLLDIEDELGRRGRGTRCEGIRQCCNYGATKKKKKNGLAGSPCRNTDRTVRRVETRD